MIRRFHASYECVFLNLQQESRVKSYNASIDHTVRLALIHQRIDDPLVLDLVGQYLHRTVDENCLYTTVTRGIRLALNGAQNSTALAGLMPKAGFQLTSC